MQSFIRFNIATT